MQPEDESLGPASILALTSEILSRGGYRTTTEGLSDLPAGRSFLAEDDFSVVAVVVFESWRELEANWTSAQAELVNLISSRLARSAPKVWDAYLVVFCQGVPDDRSQVSLIERDTTRVRKVVATSELLRGTGDVERILEPFLPLSVPALEPDLQDILNALPVLLEPEIDRMYTRVIVEAFKNLEPPMEKLHEVFKQ